MCHYNYLAVKYERSGKLSISDLQVLSSVIISVLRNLVHEVITGIY